MIRDAGRPSGIRVTVWDEASEDRNGSVDLGSTHGQDTDCKPRTEESAWHGDCGALRDLNRRHGQVDGRSHTVQSSSRHYHSPRGFGAEYDGFGDFLVRCSFDNAIRLFSGPVGEVLGILFASAESDSASAVAQTSVTPVICKNSFCQFRDSIP